MNSDLKDKVVVITGGASGIGEATAKLFAQHRARIVIVDVQMEKAEQLAQELAADSIETMAIYMDVTKFDSIKNGLSKVVKHWGGLDVMVNNAGIMNAERLPTAEHTMEDWENVIAINQTGVFYCMKASLQYMMKQQKGTIVNMASLAGLKASGNNLAYSASKFAVVGMTKSAAMEYAPFNIRINAVCPSYTETPMLDAVVEKQPGIDKKLLRFVPMGRFAQADEIAEAAVWLASEKSKFITGQCITLDGGLSL